MSGKTMNGIDIASYQKGIDLAKVECDFVIIKATEGISYINPYYDKWIQQAQKLKKCIGVYHFARPEYNDAIKEAQFFYKKTKAMYGKAIPVLDWESSGKWNVAWAKKWLDEVYRLSGVKPIFYTYENVENSYDWSPVAKAGYALWIAKYRDYEHDRNYDMSRAGKKPSVKHWKSYVMWQWTSSGRIDGYHGNLDCDIFYGDKAAWNKYAGVKLSEASKNTTTSTPKKETTTKKPTIQQAAKDVLAGKYGNGEARTKALTKLGFTAAERKQIQDLVNKSFVGPKQKTYTIKKGDTLSAIAKKNGTTATALAKKNAIKDPNKIYPGQVIKL